MYYVSAHFVFGLVVVRMYCTISCIMCFGRISETYWLIIKGMYSFISPININCFTCCVFQTFAVLLLMPCTSLKICLYYLCEPTFHAIVFFCISHILFNNNTVNIFANYNFCNHLGSTRYFPKHALNAFR